MLVIGHRGAAGLAPENTIEALQAGLDAGVDILEFDVRLTKDGVPVVIHDASTFRTHKHHMTISRSTFEQIQSSNLSPSIPSLENVFDIFFGKVLLNVELKSRGSGEAVTRLLSSRYIKHNEDWQNVMLSSFKGRELSKARRQSPMVPLAFLHDQNPFLFIAYERRLHLAAVGFHRLYINRLALEIAKQLGLFRYAYTVDRPQTVRILEHRGIDGVVTNKPDIILRFIEKE